MLAKVKKEAVISLTEFNKNIVDNYSIFRAIYGDDHKLVRDVLVYLSSKTSTQLDYDEIVFNVQEFCKLFKYDQSDLSRSHPNPLHVSRLKDAHQLEGFQELESEDKTFRIFRSCLENALYLMTIQAIDVYSKKVVGSTTNTSLSAIRLLSDVTFRTTVTPSGQTKHYYVCQLSREYKAHLYKQFCQLNISHIVKLRSSNTDTLYLRLMSLYDTLLSQPQNKGKEMVSCTYSNIEVLKQMADININNFSDAKKKLKVKIAKVNDVTDLSVELFFNKFTPTLFFYAKALKYATYNDKQRLQNSRFINFFFSEVSNTLKIKYPERENNEDIVISYLKWKENDVELLQSIFLVCLKLLLPVFYKENYNKKDYLELLQREINHFKVKANKEIFDFYLLLPKTNLLK